MHFRFNLILILSITSVDIFSNIRDYLYPYTNPSFTSYGSTGLIQMPSSRFMDAGSLAVIYSDFAPYQRISLVAYPFEWMEAIYQYTNIENRLYSPVFAFSGNQTYKDKGFDVKFRLFQETDIFPQLAFGIRDIGGTGLFAGEYLVLNKSLSNFDLTFGVATGNMSNNELRNPLSYISNRFNNRVANNTSTGGDISFGTLFRGDIDLFGGIELFLSKPKGLRFKIERDSTNYVTEGFTPLNQESKINYQLHWQRTNLLGLSLGFIRGNTIQFSFSFSGNFGKKDPFNVKPKSYQRMEKNRSQAYKNVNSRSDRNIYINTLNLLNNNKTPIRAANINGDTFEVAFSQNTYLSHPKAYAQIFRILDDTLPENLEEVRLIGHNANFELQEVTFSRDEYNRFESNKDFNSLSQSLKITQGFQSVKDFDYQPDANFPYFFWNLGPSVQSHIGGPDRFLIGGINLRADMEILLRRNLTFQGIFRQDLANTFSVLEQPSDSILPKVRTDIIEYLKKSDKATIFRSQINYFGNPTQGIYWKISAGLFEEMFGGYGFELLHRSYKSNYAFGIEAYRVKQRSFRQLLNFRDYETTTGHATLYFNEPRSGILFKFSGGKYLAKDSGITIDVSRRFKSGLRAGAFFSLTDISKEEFGEGSFDKGFYIDFPLNILTRGDSRRLTNFGLRPVTRDGAARLYVGHDLYGVTEQGSFLNFIRDIDDLYD